MNEKIRENSGFAVSKLGFVSGEQHNWHKQFAIWNDYFAKKNDCKAIWQSRLGVLSIFMNQTLVIRAMHGNQLLLQYDCNCTANSKIGSESSL